MPQFYSEVNPGDLVRAFGKLKPTNEESRLAIAMALGMRWEVAKPQPRRSAKPKTKREREQRSDRPTQPDFERLPTFRRVVTSTLDHTRSEDEAPSISVPPLEASASESDSPPPPHEPLFFPRWTRAILSAGLATNSEVGEIDVDRAVKILASGQPLKTLPLLSTPTLTRGVQLLVDRSDAMTPFIRDQIRLQKEILATVGNDRVVIMRFVGCPTRRAGAGAEPTWSNYEPPASKAPVLLLSDLGIGKPSLDDERAGVSEWLTFIERVKKAKCPLLAFVPYEESRWPPTLASKMSIIQWDRNTTAITVCNKLKHMREAYQ
jgi:hypothetical protein